MTSVFSVNNAALLILRQPYASTVLAAGPATAADKIAAIASGVSSEDDAVKTQASSAINSALLDMKGADDKIVSDALAFLDSESFQSSDPSVKDTLKQLISEKGDQFVALVNAEKAKHPGITSDNAMANAIRGLIDGNRDRFGDGEFIIGFKLANGGSIIANIADINGNSTSQLLSEESSTARAAFVDAFADFRAVDEDDPEAVKSAGRAMTASLSSALEAANAHMQWMQKWADAFGF